ncbi:hypothetical protein K432DRAFT_383071 [Lepidopterella palustris CBS 459.81]|uniref:Uncharacterized protein n=1 Tax=Lepidopterella palustris CBS 459.81 TaxID=1314670 RepID=A0A8E2E8W1_9PEZI|nr:hypothetical protein K432DRAFT_383071 [Lepidopterella palustris CBS 459.81]
MPPFRNPLTAVGGSNLFAILDAPLYLRSRYVQYLEHHEARMDELEGTLRGHIGLTEGALERLEDRGYQKIKERNHNIPLAKDIRRSRHC